jgi:putative spermidine/putrescine transport system ATP-binding protein
MTAQSKGIRLAGITKSYGGEAILHGIDLEVAPGEFVAMLGPSGSGKTTLLKIIAGFEAPDRGSVRLGGVEMSGVPPERRNIGVVFQNYSLFPHMTVAANVAFPLRMRGVARDKRREAIARALAQVALSGFEERMPDQLSGGQQQRVAIARAIVFAPEMLLMDEPLGALDRRLRADLQLEIKSLHERLGITIVYVTHDQDEALSMSDRLAVFNRGRIEQIGRPREVYRHPATLFVADFLGDSIALAAEIAGTRLTLDGVAGSFALAAPPARQGGVKLLWRSDAVGLRPAPAAAVQEGGLLVLPVTVQTAGYNGSAVRLRVRLPSGASGVVAAGEGESFAPGATVGLALDLSAAAILARDPAS